MSDVTISLDYPTINAIFSPKYLNLPALPPHLPLVLLSALFYQLVYTVFGPLLYNFFKSRTPQSPPTKASRRGWNVNIVSIAQSCVNTSLAIYLLSHPEFRNGLTAQERTLGYHKETAMALAVSMGYFCFHLAQTWVHRRIYGMFMFMHGVCALVAVALGFRPLALHYTATFLIWEFPNLFLNIQRQLDNSGRQKTWIRAVNRSFLLSTYVTARLGLGTISMIQMARDITTTVRDLHPEVGAAHVVPYLLRVGEGQSQEVPRLPFLLACFQLGSMGLLHFQGFYWFAKIVFKGDLRKNV